MRSSRLRPDSVYKHLPTLGDVALVWADRNGINLGVVAPVDAQRALEIALDAMDWSVRIGMYGWQQVRRMWCQFVGEADPRAHLRRAKRRDEWTHWLATLGFERGDIVTAGEAEHLRAVLPANAADCHPLLSPYRGAWRLRKPDGTISAPGYALVLQRTNDGRVLIDILPTLALKSQSGRSYDAAARRVATVAQAKRRRQARVQLGVRNTRDNTRDNTAQRAPKSTNEVCGALQNRSAFDGVTGPVSGFRRSGEPAGRPGASTLHLRGSRSDRVV
jgi:hypothetical protein